MAKLAALPPASIPWVNKDGTPTLALSQFMTAIAANNIGPFISAANDAAANKAGVQVNTVYEDGGALRVRKT